MNKKLLLTLGVFLLILVSLYLIYLSKIPKVEDYWVVPEEKDLYACETDTDCMLVPKKCCGCNSGGSETSINKWYHEFWLIKMNFECGENYACTTMFNCRGETPKCIDNKCVVRYSNKL